MHSNLDNIKRQREINRSHPVNLAGKTALVTGGSNDTGKAICRTLAGAGVSVIIHYHKNKAAAEKTCMGITAMGGTAVSYGADISDKNSTESMFKFIKDRFGRLDILVNNAHLPITRSFFNASSYRNISQLLIR